MKIIIDQHKLPDTHWTDWTPEDFGNTHYPWEHPAISRLGYYSRVDYHTLDADSDVLLDNWAMKFWSEDIINRKHEFSHELVDLAQKVKDIKKNLDNLKDEYSSLPSLSYYADSLSLKERQEYMERSDEERKKLRVSLSQVMPDFLISIIKNNYEASRDHINDVLLMIDNEDDPGMYEYLASKGTDEVQSRINSFDRLYTLSLMMFPGENLTSYLHDCMLFMNYIQTIVTYDDEMEKELVRNNTLLTDSKDIDEDVLRSVISHRNDWWT